MKYKVIHFDNKPVELEHRKEFDSSWRSFCDKVFSLKIDKTDSKQMKKISKALQTKENKLKRKYPSETIWDIENAEQMQDIINEYGCISLFNDKDDKTPTLMVYDLEIDNEQNIDRSGTPEENGSEDTDINSDIVQSLTGNAIETGISTQEDSPNAETESEQLVSEKNTD